MKLSKCKICGGQVFDYPSRKRVYCSLKCRNIATSRAMKGNQFSKGRVQSEKERELKRKSMLGRHADSKNPGWKGNKVGYQGLHQWVRRKLGTPSYCRGKNCD